MSSPRHGCTSEQNLEEASRIQGLLCSKPGHPQASPETTPHTRTRGDLRKEVCGRKPQRDLKWCLSYSPRPTKGPLEVLQVGPDPPRKTTGCPERACCPGLGRGFLGKWRGGSGPVKLTTH